MYNLHKYIKQMKNINCWLHLLWSNSNIAIRTIMIIIGQRINAKWYQTAATTTPKIRWKDEKNKFNFSFCNFYPKKQIAKHMPHWIKLVLLSTAVVIWKFRKISYCLVVSLLLYPRVYICRSWASPFFYILFLFSKQISHLSK